MTRIGMNPARNRLSQYRPARVTVAMLVYLPHLTGYFENRLDVVKLSMASLIAGTQSEYDLLVFDNGSCAEVKEWLRDLQASGVIRYLITSAENIGKLGALRIIAGAAPGELVAYTDDDTFFYAGWLKAHVDLYDHFPNVGMVSGSPERTLFDHGIQANLAFANSHDGTNLSYGKRIPEQWEREWALALGKDADEFAERVLSLDDVILELKGVEAFATACHNQFLSPKPVLQEFLQRDWSGRLMGGLNEFDNMIDDAGYLRITTRERTTRLIGNVLSKGILEEANRIGIQSDLHAWKGRDTRREGFRRRIARWKPVRWVLQGLYNRLFWLLAGQTGGWVTEQSEEESDAKL
jgi:glycosyltransferase involved in cell wall biosynthesis